jgi:branched-chain amino acid transport system ATP-binding protein
MTGARADVPASGTDQLVLQLTDLHVRYGPIEAVRGVDVELPRGTLLALLGPNGAGKTSTLSAIAGLHAPSAGRVCMHGDDITGQPAHRLARRGIRMVPETRGLFADMTVIDNLAVGAVGGRLRPAELDRIFEVFTVLGKRQGQRAGNLSGGEQQQLAIARALVGEPTVLLLDEPSMGLAPRIVAEIMRVLRRLAGDGLSVLLAEQNAHAALSAVDDVVLLDRGRVAVRGRPDDVRSRVLGGYLSGGASP